MSTPKKNVTPTAGGRSIDGAQSRRAHQALCDAARALGAQSLLQSAPWSDKPGPDVPNDAAVTALQNALSLTQELHARAVSFESLTADEQKKLVKSLKTHKKASAEELRTIGNDVRNRSEDVVLDLQRHIKDFGDTLAAELRSELPGADVSDIKRFLESYIHERFEEALRERTRAAGEQIEHIVEHARALVQQNWQQHANDALGPIATKVDLRVDSFRFDVGVMALSAVGMSLMFSNFLLGGLLTLAAPAAAFAIKGKLDQKSKGRAVQEVPHEVVKASGRLADEVGAKLREATGEIAARLEQYGALWPTALLESLRATQDGASKPDDADKAVTELKKLLLA